MTRIYLDVCCLNRPFDDQSQVRIRLESEAIILILRKFDTGEWRWLGSAVIDYEVERTPNIDRRRRVRELVRQAEEHVLVDASIVQRSQDLKAMGFKTYDALHIACAEHAQADVFLSTDDQLVQVAALNARELRVHVANPLNWLKEVIHHG